MTPSAEDAMLAPAMGTVMPSWLPSQDEAHRLVRFGVLALVLLLHGSVGALLLSGQGPGVPPPTGSMPTLAVQLAMVPPSAFGQAVADTPVPEPPAPEPAPEPPAPEPPVPEPPAPEPPAPEPPVPEPPAPEPPAPEPVVEPTKVTPQAARQPAVPERTVRAKPDTTPQARPARRNAESLEPAPPVSPGTTAGSRSSEPPAAPVSAEAMASQLASLASSSSYQPISKQAPAYPPRALQQQLEGDCTVRYTVSAQGRVEDPHIDGECHPLFVRPSLQSAATFRYRPHRVNGVAVAVPSVRNTFHYRIQKGQ